MIHQLYLQLILQIRTNHSEPYADIRNYSYDKHEREILFSMGTIFRIKSAEQYTETLWFIKLVLITTESELALKSLVVHFPNKDIGDRSALEKLGDFLERQDDCEKAIRNYKLIFYMNYY
ncbi:unnamed protein product [Didymodactylos carnosus]|uniref:Uncharacterized protein n=1 Tax=Didymodactylos carnosus TaxID=1234261 RepID=A0A8S2D9L9_9BILA|nr:unnamed protein product [Didymodactylos carnosus]CAF3662424.1 unnamed protein product [Didymodactylos carnosus]